MFSGAPALIDIPCCQNVKKIYCQEKKLISSLLMMLGCSSSLEENQFSSLAGLTDALQTNPHQIKTCMVTEYWHLRQWEKKDGAACPGFPKIWQQWLISYLLLLCLTLERSMWPSCTIIPSQSQRAKQPVAHRLHLWVNTNPNCIWMFSIKWGP